MIPFLAEEVRSAANVFVTELAPEAVTALAVVAVKLNEGLRVSSIFAGDASRCPIANDGVVLRFELFPQGEGAVTEGLVGLILAVGKEHGSHAVDDDELNGRR